MTNQSITTNRPLLWDDDPPVEMRTRRLREDAPAEPRLRRRGSPGMPVHLDEEDDDGVLRPPAERFRASSAARASRSIWWWPRSSAGRVFVGLGTLAVLGGFALAGLSLAHIIERDARFRIAGSSDIQATGLAEVSRDDLLPVFGADIGRNVFFVPLRQRRHQLEEIPWIEHATVMRVLPDQIRVAIVERKPVAFTRNGQQIGLVDANGVLLSMSPKTMARRHYSFPVVTGIDPGDSAPSRKARMAVYGRLMADLDAGGQRNSQEISEIDLTDPEDARVLMPAGGKDILAHFGEDHFLERFERYRAHIAEWRQQYPQLKSVDLRYDNQVVLEMASGGTAATGSSALAAASAPSLHAPENKAAAPAAKKHLASAGKTATKKKSAQKRPHLRGKKRKLSGKLAEARRAARPPRRPAAAATRSHAVSGAMQG